MNRLYSLALYAITLGIIALVVVSVFFGNKLFTPAKPTVNLSHESVIKQIQSLNRLETASYTIEKIIEVGNNEDSVRTFLFGDKLILIANGKVIAGVDLAQLKDEDVTITDNILTVNLPVPIIFSTNLDSTKTQVYDRTQGIFNRGGKDLETEARKAAETSITKAACDAGILNEARTNASERIKQLYGFAGFTNVQVTIPEGKCSL